MKITPIIGLEVHVELKTKSKMFCSCDAQHFHIEPNTHTCPVCLGLPGALPVPNKTACEWCVKLGLALNCTPNKISFFERKNYFYPDLPKGYQITQLEKPFVVNGFLEIDGQKIRINRAHMEEDTGKSVHTTENGVDITLIDYNRSSVPLVEIVSEPDITSAEMAKKYLLKIQQIVRYLGISDADIEKGSMRCEPTINLKIEDNEQTFYTPLVEVKNVASLTGVQTAIDFEINRQTEEFEKNHEVKSSLNKTTRGWDADKNQTFLQREKEGSSDYRYFPEPDIPHIVFTDEQIEEIRKTIPELPDEKFARYKSYDLSDYDAHLLSKEPFFAGIFDFILRSSTDPSFAKFVANLMLGSLKTIQIDIEKIIPDNFKKLFDNKNNLSSTAIKQLIVDSYQTGKDPLIIAKEQGLMQVSDTSAIESFAKEVIDQNPKAVEDYKKNPASIGFLIGQLMKASHGSANPQMAKEILEKLLK
ncbi:MAG: Asp-tRNA(Asn)/Glu-tRNA(Gln) amidotransferase subunit GatB [Candidatus Shapirobacteria bacterium]|nr:Asp-tRNA(Asn)/Glu-tRNA(Gln) amidotransferase subunit GatB [Candidatus Shapirobacteria bacterium]MDD3002396.1 Asp-tRNA(Asn)/Glu-tRNA(Gln) amidotransferase subunit GatB [Candidatus Shapirobacteria bacterium]MDD4383296.1 Asp-tRNA(Asn)/Glu-tRNA(Gln) amidotransferase subunit GatB [Candidatus Shapirobacteria bacterium]